MKKGIILLITLFFTTAISLLVLKNIDDTDIFIERQNYVLNNTQLLISIKNVQEEIKDILTDENKNIEDILGEDGISFPVSIEELKIVSTLKNYDRVDVNEIKKNSDETADTRPVRELFDEYNIYDYNIFEEVYYLRVKGNDDSIESNKQLDDIINDFIVKSENQKIEKIRNKLGFSPTAKYELNINVKYLGTKASAYYLLDGEGEVLYFDISLI